MKRIVLSLYLLTLFVFAGNSYAQTPLWGSTGKDGAMLVNLHPGSGIGVPLYPHGAYGPVTEIEYRDDGVLFGSTGGGFPNIITINIHTGVEFLVGTHVLGAVNGLEFVGNVLYGTFIPAAHTPSDLVIVDQNTGQLSFIGPTGMTGPIGGLAYDKRRKIMYGSSGNMLVTIDLNTGAATPVGPTGFPNVTALEFNPDDGQLYGGVSYQGHAIADLIVIDPNTGAGTLVGSTGFPSLSGLAFISVFQVPLSNWSIYLAILLIAIGMVVAYRRF